MMQEVALMPNGITNLAKKVRQAMYLRIFSKNGADYPQGISGAVVIVIGIVSDIILP